VQETAASIVPRLEEAIATFWAPGGQTRRAALELGDALSALALSEHPAAALRGTELLFGEVVEPLCDAFSPRLAALYDALFARVLQACRKHSGGEALDRELGAAGLHSAAGLCARRRRLLRLLPAPARAPRERVRKVLVLSRVTLGADIAVASVVLNRASELFPAAELLFLAPPASGAIVAGHGRIRLRSVPYERRGPLLPRIAAWPELLQSVREELGELRPDELLLIDTDSRLTQLGLLPLGADRSTAHFASRGFAAPKRQRLGELAAAWMDGWLGPGTDPLPRIWPAPADVAWREALRRRMREAGPQPLVSLSFGAGGNARKQLDEPLEAALLASLCQAGARVLLCRGSGEAETARARRVA
jgi:hypothetical protein